MGERKVPNVQDWWWRRNAALGCLEPQFVVPAGLSSSGPYPATWVHHSADDFGGCRTTRLEVKDDGRWIAPVLTPSEAAALTARAEAAESTLARVRACADDLEMLGWRDLESRSPDVAHGMNAAGARIRAILDGGDHG